MYRTFSQLLLLVTVVSARTIDVHVEEIDTISLKSLFHTGCRWDGTAPFCAGACKPEEKECRLDSRGDGELCLTGVKALCCTSSCPSSLSMGRKSALPAENKQQISLTGKFELLSTACAWSGTSPFCESGCDGLNECAQSRCGDGACCISGHKSLCCDGECPSSSQLLALSSSSHVDSTDQPSKNGDYDDMCKDDEFICCVPGALGNIDCKCIKREAAKSAGSLKPITIKGTNDDLCKDKETLCCNPGAEKNKECGCIDESLMAFSREL